MVASPVLQNPIILGYVERCCQGYDRPPLRKEYDLIHIR